MIYEEVLVSVIIPSYKTARYLPEAIESALRQTHARVEIIVVNDGSPDNTDDVVQPYLDRIAYIKQENRGLSAARNVGFRSSHGEFVCFLDADDILLSDKFEQQLLVFEREPDLGVVISSYIDVEEDGQTEIQVARKNWKHDALDHLLNHEVFPPHVPLIRRSVLEKSTQFPENIHTLEFQEDWQLWLDLALNGVRFSCLSEPTCKYRRRQSSHGALNPLRHLDGARRVVQWLRTHPKAMPYHERIDRLAAIVEMERVARAWQVGQTDLATETLVSVVRQSPSFWQIPGNWIRLMERSLTIREGVAWQSHRDPAWFKDRVIDRLIPLLNGSLTRIEIDSLFSAAYLALADLAYAAGNHSDCWCALGKALRYSTRTCVSTPACASTGRALLGPRIGGVFGRMSRIVFPNSKEPFQT